MSVRPPLVVRRSVRVEPSRLPGFRHPAQSLRSPAFLNRVASRSAGSMMTGQSSAVNLRRFFCRMLRPRTMLRMSARHLALNSMPLAG